VSISRPTPFFVAGNVGLDFLNSIATPVDVPVEWIGCGEDLLRWLLAAKLLTRAEAAMVRKHATPAELDAVAAQARELRDWFRGFVRARLGKPLGRRAVEQLEPINRLLATDDEYRQLVAGSTGGVRSERRRAWHSSGALLLLIANALADVVCDEDFTRIKACEGPICTLLYVDRTRTHARRWCSMAVCGNRSKQAAHRVRRRD
jgi:predicted RNA-binding Zn ribbon-like protein